MGDDWRLFRAKLVAQEQLEKTSSSKNGNSKQNKLSLFSGALSSLFSQQKQNENDSSASDDILYNYDGIGETSKAYDDPFLSAEEMVAVCNDNKISVSKHRWAHPLSHVEQGCVLIANEKLGGVFHQTVVLIVDHHDALGSTGIVINRPYPGNLLKVASETTSNVDLSLKLAFNKSPVTFGGPIMQSDFSVLHGYGEVEGSKKVAPGIFIGGSRELMDAVRKNNFDPSNALFVKGHSSWMQSQLSREVDKGVWYVASVSPDFILRYAGAKMEEGDNANDLWSDILTCMGGEFKDIAEKHANRGDMRMAP